MDDGLERTDTRAFGALLREFRLSYYDRVRPHRPGTPSPRMRLSALALIQALDEAGFTISPAAYSEIEAGINLPRDPRRFLKAACLCLELKAHECRMLAQELGYDLVKGKLGELSESFEQASQFGHALRKWRGRVDFSREDLARALIASGFSSPRASTASEVADGIKAIESGEPWPFGADRRQQFVDLCGQILSKSPDARKELAIAMAIDILRAIDPDAKPFQSLWNAAKFP